MVESSICTRWAVPLVAASASNMASNTPARLSRQKRFQTAFQSPNLAGSARHVPPGLWEAGDADVHLPLGLRAAKARAAASRPTSSSCRFRSSTIWSRRTRSGRNRRRTGGGCDAMASLKGSGESADCCRHERLTILFGAALTICALFILGEPERAQPCQLSRPGCRDAEYP